MAILFTEALGRARSQYIKTLDSLSQSKGPLEKTISGKISRIFQASMLITPCVLVYKYPLSPVQGIIFAALAITVYDYVFPYFENSRYLKKTESTPQELVQKLIAQDNLLKNKFSVCLSGPIAEEVLFRGILQSVLTKLGQLIFIGSPEWVTPSFSIVTTAALFAIAHAPNVENNKYREIVQASFGGLLIGAASEQFGFATGTFTHIFINSWGYNSIWRHSLACTQRKIQNL